MNKITDDLSEKDRLLGLGHVPGNIYLIKSDQGGWGVMKLLTLDEGGVHIRIYANHFTEKPGHIDVSQLTLGSVHEEHFGVGHMPVSYETIASWSPEYVACEPVTEGELEGFKIWEKDGQGNYF